MGYIRHDAVLVATETYREGGLPDVAGFRMSLPARWQPLVIGPIITPVNRTVLYAFLPDGSKEGWQDSHDGDRYREEFRRLFRFAYDDGSSPDDVVTVSFGGDHGSEVGASVVANWPPYNNDDVEVQP